MNNYGILVFLWENSSFLWERGVANGKSLNDPSYGTKLALTDVVTSSFHPGALSIVINTKAYWLWHLFFRTQLVFFRNQYDFLA